MIFLYNKKKHYFIQDYDHSGFHYHTYQGSEIRHVSIEKIPDLLRDLFYKVFGLDMNHLFLEILYFPISIIYGMNCNFKLKDIFQFLRYNLMIFNKARKKRKENER